MGGSDPGRCRASTRLDGERSVLSADDRVREGRFTPALVAWVRELGAEVGALNLYSTSTGEFRDEDVRVAQAFADVAAIGIIQARRACDAEERAGQLQHALDSRVAIEQAKGILSAERGISLEDAFTAIRDHARSNQRKVHDVAQLVIDAGASGLDTP